MFVRIHSPSEVCIFICTLILHTNVLLYAQNLMYVYLIIYPSLMYSLELTLKFSFV